MGEDGYKCGLGLHQTLRLSLEMKEGRALHFATSVSQRERDGEVGDGLHYKT